MPKKVLHKTQVRETIGVVSACFPSWSNGTTRYTSQIDAGGTVRTSQENPNWRYDIFKGRSATTNFLADEVEVSYSPGYLETRRLCNTGALYPIEGQCIEKISGYLNGGFQSVQLPNAPSEVLNDSVDGRARQEFVKRARDKQGAFRGATVVAELADTLRGIRNPLLALRRSVDRYSNVARKRVRKALGKGLRDVTVEELTEKQSRAAQRALSETWLESQFSWLPLVSDVKDGLQAYNRFADRRNLEPVWASAEEIGVPVITFATVTNHDSATVHTEIHTSERARVRYYGAVKLSTSTYHSSLAEEAGFRIRDFLPALWEWIPYSFLVDYFTNIGEIVEAASFPRSNLAWCSRTFVNSVVRDGTRMKAVRRTSTAYPLTNYTEVLAFFPSPITITRKFVSRADFLGGLVPDFQVEMPGFRNFRRFLNIGALVHLRGLRRAARR